MLGWPGSPLPKFNEKLSSQFVTVAGGVRAVHLDDGEMGGVVFLDRPLTAVDSFRYFEVVLEVVCQGEQDGLTLGVTTRLPLVNEECPGCADDVHFSWSLGYDGRAHIHGANDLVLTAFNPKDLNVGDRVGFLVGSDGAACVLVNDVRVVNLPGVVPPDLALYGLVDLLGHAKGVVLTETTLPPESALDFCLQTVRDEALDAMYSALSSGSRDRVKAAVNTARLVGIDEAVIRQTERVVKAMPCFQPPPRGPPPARPGQGASSMSTAMKTSSSSSTKSFAPRGGSNENREDAANGRRIDRPTMKAARRAPQSSRLKDSRSSQQLKSISEADGLESPPLPEKMPPTLPPIHVPPVEMQKVDAENAMSEAFTSGRLNSFRETLNRAEALDVEPAVLAQAHERLHELETRSEAERALVDALAVGGLNSLRMALREATTANVDPTTLVRARERLETMELGCRREAEMALHDGFESGDLESCRRALNQATIAHVEPSILAGYHERLQELELREAAETSLANSLASDDIASLRRALKQAETANLESSDVLGQTRERLDFLEAECKCEAERELAVALAWNNLDDLWAAIQQAIFAHVDASLISKAQTQAQELERRCDAEKALAAALASGDFNGLKLALSEAKLACVSPAAMVKPQARFQELERRGEAARALADALLLGELDSLRNCVSEAIAAQVQPDLVSRALRRLDELERKCEEAIKHLEEAVAKARNMSPPTVDALEALDAAIAQAATSGAAVASVRTLSESLRVEMAEAAREAAQVLTKALPSRDALHIRKCLETCRALGADHAVAEALSVIAFWLRAEMEKARHAEREERGDMLPGMEALLGILREHLHPELRMLHNDLQDLKGAVRVFCRVRPLITRELLLNDAVAVTSPNQFTVTVTASKKSAPEALVSDSFNYDAVFMENSSQAEIFAECRSLVQSAFDGYNITIFTYGQTGAGKTWTLYGSPEEPGISPRTCEQVFEVIERDRDKFQFTVSASMVELYNNTVCDLLSFQRLPPRIDIRKTRIDEGGEVVRLDCTEVEVVSATELINAVERGFRQRKVTSTTMNADSSRSHLLFMIKLMISDSATGRSRLGKITIVDLAGSERISKSNAIGDVKKEAIEINKSLTALGDVISAITSGAKVVPYRNHKLTMLMQDSLGGTAKTLMFVNISPSSNNADETISALKYASRARCIINNICGAPAVKNPSPRRRVPGQSPRLTRSYSSQGTLPRYYPPLHGSTAPSPRPSSPSPRRTAPTASPRMGLGPSPRISRMYSSPGFGHSASRDRIGR